LQALREEGDLAPPVQYVLFLPFSPLFFFSICFPATFRFLYASIFFSFFFFFALHDNYPLFQTSVCYQQGCCRSTPCCCQRQQPGTTTASIIAGARVTAAYTSVRAMCM
jgi:hypothetical protein